MVVEQDILGLEMAVDDIEVVQTHEGAKQLCGVQSRSVNIETLRHLQVVEQDSVVDKG